MGGWRDGPFPEDYDLWLRLAAAGGRLANVPRTLLDWRESGGRLTRTDPRYGLDRHVALKCAALAAGPAPRRGRGGALGGRRDRQGLRRRPGGGRGSGWPLFLEVDRKKIGRTVRGAPVRSYEEVGAVRGLPLLVAVGAPGARDLIRAELLKRGFEELRDFRCVA